MPIGYAEHRSRSQRLRFYGWADDGDREEDRDGGLVGDIENHYVSEDDGAIADEKGEFVVVGPKGRSARAVGRDNLVPRAFGLVSLYEGVISEPCIVDAHCEPRLSGVAGPVVNHGRKCDCSGEGEAEVAIVESG
jgi:hypothetical protein